MRIQRVFAAAHGAHAAPHLELRPVFVLFILIRFGSFSSQILPRDYGGPEDFLILYNAHARCGK